jgi:uncharacterized protein YdbL (DUF1318 family)
MMGMFFKNRQSGYQPSRRQLGQSHLAKITIRHVLANSMLRRKDMFLSGDKIIATLYWFIVGVLLSACVTVNVYFPAAAAERAADRIIQDVWREVPEEREMPAPTTSPLPQSQQPAAQVRQIAVWEGMLNVLIPPAQAAAADININTPEINLLKNAMAARFQRLAKYFSSGAVGLTRNGLLAVRDLNAVPLPQRATVNRLVAQDNNDRNALYREIARANNHPEWESDIRSVFAREWIDNARPGWWYQSAGGWVKK